MIYIVSLMIDLVINYDYHVRRRRVDLTNIFLTINPSICEQDLRSCFD